MTKLRSRFTGLVPRNLMPLAKRQLRRLDQLRGLPTSHRRPGVVLMLHVGRCGSTVLANLLAQNPKVFWDGKLPRKAKQLYGIQGAARIDHAAWTQAQFAISGDRYYGFEFKILADHYPAIFNTSTEAFLDTCDRIGVTHYILLARRNTLRHVVSHYASKSRGNWHAEAGEKVQKKEFALDLEDITTGRAPGRTLQDYIAEVKAAHEQVRTQLADKNFLELEYEHDIDAAGAEAAYARICEFLNIAPGTVEIRNRKMNPYPLSSVLTNYDEVAQTLEGTEFAWMAQD